MISVLALSQGNDDLLGLLDYTIVVVPEGTGDYAR